MCRREEGQHGHRTAYGESAVSDSHSLTNFLEDMLRVPPRPAGGWYRAGLSPRGESVFDLASTVLLLLLAVGWSWAIVTGRMSGAVTPGGATEVTAGISAALTRADVPATAYLTDRVIDAFSPLRGASGKLRAVIQTPGSRLPVDSLPTGARLQYSAGGEVATDTTRAPQHSGIWQLAIRVGSFLKPVSDLQVITLVPFSEKRNGRVGLYFIGNWPAERGGAVRANYAPPPGFIEVTPANADTRVSEHFRLRDFLTHDQPNVWPKYLVLNPRLVDKLELVLADLAARGIPSEGIHIMSGFRTPRYNAGGGDRRGRAALSRHMYGDASDVWIDNDHDGRMDDLNRDGRVDIADARVIQDAVDRVERAHPELVGGCGTYPATSSHGPFTHIDTRGYRARWIGTGDG